MEDLKTVVPKEPAKDVKQPTRSVRFILQNLLASPVLVVTPTEDVMLEPHQSRPASKAVAESAHTQELILKGIIKQSSSN